MMLRRLGLVLAAVLCMAAASDPSERLPDAAAEARARELFQQVRCVVCQNESIDDSTADLARDLRMLVRQKVAEGRSDQEIKDFLVERYGEFILLKPSFSLGNALLWLTPLLIIIAGGALFASRARRETALESALTPEEEAQLRTLADQSRHDTVAPQNGRKPS